MSELLSKWQWWVLVGGDCCHQHVFAPFYCHCLGANNLPSESVAIGEDAAPASTAHSTAIAASRAKSTSRSLSRSHLNLCHFFRRVVWGDLWHWRGALVKLLAWVPCHFSSQWPMSRFHFSLFLVFLFFPFLSGLHFYSTY